MKTFAARFFLLVALGTVLISVGGCQADDPENISVRPWNSPSDSQSILPIDSGQHK